MLPEINWDLAWTIACGIILGASVLNILSLLDRMLQDNWKVAILIIFCFTIFPATILGAFFEYFGWMWSILGFVASFVCYFVATYILTSEDREVENF
jgi:hypothetical protein